MWLVSAAICFSTSLKNYFYLNIKNFFLQRGVGFCHTTMPKVLGSFVLAAVHVGLVSVPINLPARKIAILFFTI